MPSDLRVAPFITVKLARPKLAVRSRKTAVCRASVPKTAINEYGESLPGNTKSGLPKIGACRRHPLIPSLRRFATNRPSVDLLPRPFTRDIISDLFFTEKTSAIVVTNGARQYANAPILTNRPNALHLSAVKSSQYLAGMAADKFRRQRIAYHQRNRLLARFRREAIALGKTLQERRFSQGDGAVFTRM